MDLYVDRPENITFTFVIFGTHIDICHFNLIFQFMFMFQFKV